MPEGTAIEIKPAKGRPMLTWAGKRPLRRVTAFPAQIVPFAHPLSPPDLGLVKRELGARPEEERDVTVVCLAAGVEPVAHAAELARPDHGHRAADRSPLWALLRAPASTGEGAGEAGEGKIRVAIEEFVSPTIAGRLKEQAGVLAPQTDDWRAMVDSVMIDLAYDGEVFRVALADVPERKRDLVAPECELEPPAALDPPAPRCYSVDTVPKPSCLRLPEHPGRTRTCERGSSCRAVTPSP